MSQEKSAEIIDLDASRSAATGDYAGAFLQRARHSASLEIGTVAAATKIRHEHLEAIEAGDAGRLPATPYAVGFVKVYAKYLGLDAEAVAAQFKKEITAARPVQAPPRTMSTIPATDTSVGVKLASLIGIVLIGAFAIWIAFQITGNSERESREAAAAGPKINVSDVRAEAPRPRTYSDTNLPVVPIPSVGSIADASDDGVTDGAGNTALTETGVEADPAGIELQEPTRPVPQQMPSAQQQAAIEAPVVVEAPAPETPLLAPLIAAVPVDLNSSSVAQTAEPDQVIANTAPALTQSPASIQPVATPVPEPIIIDARLVRSIGPDYPLRCGRRAGEMESVAVIFDVTAAGRPANTRVTSSTNSCFEGAAVETIAKWRFNPRTVDGAPRPQSGVQATLNFRQ